MSVINEDILKNVVDEYKNIFDDRWKEERYKWEAVKYFQDNWDIDSPDFAGMLDKCLSKTGNLLTAARLFSKNMICNYAKANPNNARKMFVDLFDESRDLYERINAFKDEAIKNI